jgi:hypothetical protein
MTNELTFVHRILLREREPCGHIAGRERYVWRLGVGLMRRRVPPAGYEQYSNAPHEQQPERLEPAASQPLQLEPSKGEHLSDRYGQLRCSVCRYSRPSA